MTPVVSFQVEPCLASYPNVLQAKEERSLNQVRQKYDFENKLEWNVTTLIRWGSNYSFLAVFIAPDCS